VEAIKDGLSLFSTDFFHFQLEQTPCATELNIEKSTDKVADVNSVVDVHVC